jgi:hypothetical protein
MTDELRQLEAQLELATRPGAEPDGKLPPDTAALRAGWLALESLLDAAQQGMTPSLQPLPPTPARRFRRLKVAAIAILAASMLFAVTLAAYLQTVKRIGNSGGAASDVAWKGIEQENRQTGMRKTELEGASSAMGHGEMAWGDTIDDEVESIQQAFQHSQHESSVLASASNEIQYRLAVLQSDFDENSL